MPNSNVQACVMCTVVIAFFLTLCFSLKIILRGTPCFIGNIPLLRYLCILSFLYPLYSLYPARRTNVSDRTCCLLRLWTLLFLCLSCGTLRRFIDSPLVKNERTLMITAFIPIFHILVRLQKKLDFYNTEIDHRKIRQ